MNDIALFQFSTEEDISYVLEFSGLVLTGRSFEVKIKDRASNTTRATLSNGSGLTITGTNVLEAAYALAGTSGWPRGEYSADVVDVTGGTHARIMAVRFVLDLPGRLVQGVRDRKAFVQWSPNQAVVTATGAIGPAGPKGDKGDKGDQGDLGPTGPAGTITVGDVTTGAAGSSVIVTNVGTPENAVLDFTIPEGDQGIQGLTGNKGWSPAFAIVSDGARRVLQVDDWVGGEGVKPATGDYVGATGLTPVIGDAIDIRGPAGTATIPDGNKGDITTSAGGDTWEINSGAVGEVEIAAEAVTNAKLANMATARIKGRTTAGTGDPEDLTGAQATALLDAFIGDSGSGGTKGLVPAPAAGDAAAGKFLKADGTWSSTSTVGKTLIKIDVLTASGTWTRPTGATTAEVFLWGGGGSGAAAASPSSSQGAGGSGGGGGGFSYRYITSLPNTTESYTVGAGGAATAAGNNNGNSGGASSFGTSPYISATGGAGGTNSTSTANNFAAGGAGGVGSGGDVNLKGEAGGTLVISTAASGSFRYSGKGGAAPNGGCGGDAVVGGTASNGNAGVGAGAGGSGALSFNGASAATGGAGANGLIIVKSYG